MQPGTGPLDHLGFQVMSREAVEQAKQRLQKAGLATFDETDTTCCYALQDKIWVHDPDGNAWEVYVLLDDHEHDHAGNLLSETLPLNQSFRTLAHAIPLTVPGGACCSGATSEES